MAENEPDWNALIEDIRRMPKGGVKFFHHRYRGLFPVEVKDALRISNQQNSPLEQVPIAQNAQFVWMLHPVLAKLGAGFFP